MSYIGNPIVSTDFPKDKFSGNGSTTAFTMSIAPASVNSVLVIVSGITQSPDTYTISGTTLTFSAAPPTGTDNILVRHLGVAGIPNTPSAGSVVTSSIADSNVTPAKLSTGSPSWDSSGNLSFNSGYGSVATAYGCRAWVNFNGTGTVAINGSGNVSSITDNGTGDYTVNFTTNMPNTSYTYTTSQHSTIDALTQFTLNCQQRTVSSIKTVSSARFLSGTTSAAVDCDDCCVAFFR